MIRLNLRGGDNGDSTFTFGETRWMDSDGNVIPRSILVEMTAGKRLCFLVHGYNVDEAMDAYARITLRIQDLYDEVVGVTWPGSKVKIGFWPAEQRADAAGRILAAEVASLCCKPPDLEGHSCGCRAASEAVRSGMKVRNLILAAAAYNNEDVHIGNRYGQSMQRNASTVLVAYSGQDTVLGKAFRLSSWLKRAARLKFTGDDCKALGYTGPQDSSKCPSNLIAVRFDDHTHGAYKTSGMFISEWRTIAAA